MADALHHSRFYERGQRGYLFDQILCSSLFTAFDDSSHNLLIRRTSMDQNYFLKTEEFDFYLLRDVFRMANNHGVLKNNKTGAYIVAQGELDKQSLSYGVIGFFLPEGTEVEAAEQLFLLWLNHAKLLSKSDYLLGASLLNDETKIKTIIDTYIKPIFEPIAPVAINPPAPSATPVKPA